MTIAVAEALMNGGEPVASFRAALCDASFDDDWDAEIEKNYKRRGGQR